jgi:hypothetical protein
MGLVLDVDCTYSQQSSRYINPCADYFIQTIQDLGLLPIILEDLLSMLEEGKE